MGDPLYFCGGAVARTEVATIETLTHAETLAFLRRHLLDRTARAALVVARQSPKRPVRCWRALPGSRSDGADATASVSGAVTLCGAREQSTAEWPTDGSVTVVADLADFRAGLEAYAAPRPAGHPSRLARRAL